MTRSLAFAASLVAGLSVSLGALAQPAAAGASSIAGVWRNPKDTVHVEIRSCEGSTCGYVVWASPRAEADARKGGTERLVGLQLFRQFEQDKHGTWRGKVFVPDLNATFSGSALLVDANTLRAKGCLFANVLCKAQDWRRVARPAG